MQYKPLDNFFRHIQIDITSISADNLGRIRKVINAEFALADTGIIEVEGVSFSKQDLLDVLDAQNVLELLNAYQSISQHTMFSDFLLTGNFHPLMHLDVAVLANKSIVVKLTSAATAVQFNKNQRRLLVDCQFQAAAQLMQLIPMIRMEDSEQALQSVREYMEEGIYLFKNTNKVTHFEKLANLNRWTLDWAPWANEIPDLLLDQKRELVTKLINYCVEIEKVDKKTTYLISKQLVELRFLTNTLYQLVVENHAVFEKNVANLKILPKNIQRKHRKKWGARSIWLIMFGILLMVRLVDVVFDDDKTKKLSKSKTDKMEQEQVIGEKFLKEKEQTIFNEFPTFEADSSLFILSPKANLISYLVLDTSIRGVKVRNTTTVDFVLFLYTSDGLLDLLLEKHTSQDFYHSADAPINFLLFSKANRTDYTINKENLIGGNWIAYKEKNVLISASNLKLFHDNVQLNIGDPKPPVDFLLLTIIQSGDTFFLGHDDKVDAVVKSLEE